MKAALLAGRQAVGDGPPVAGPVIWWDASDTSTITTSGNEVTAMTDKSGNGYNLARRTTGPDSGTRTINSLNVLDFVAASSELLEATIASSIISPTVNHTMFIVGRYDTGANGGFVGEGSTSNANVRAVVRTSASPGNLRHESINTAGATNQFDDGALNTNPHIITVYCAGSTAEIGLDGAARTTDSTVQSAVGTNRIGIGGYPRATPAYYFDGAIGEVLIYASALSSGDIDTVEAYLSAKWGISI